ncbi:DUF1460 domain-containing protein [Cellulophaga baltica]|uniref:N-acetylmuramoyl-L-alanine amidase-like domain-containing protein n=1 Tax=Cellulophaga TaxID=104264 RepID=UPI001C070AE1|nr:MULTISPECIES: N-acetylmuramoyl-L-alanine amidase-like domain-containing protein [Cellulophaga]MBU2997608.1 DUF1460 domain-containing protein [Cellulophaga baltica]MDO6769003.1 DUF1460 domain-containing protein [Cellulophaga sp. 1_MG-2023]
MFKTITTLFLFLNFTISFAQQLFCSVQDKQAVKSKITQLESLIKDNINNTMVAVGKTFLDTPYIAKTLEIGNTESLVINLQGLDCTTYIENVLAFSLLTKKDTPTFDDFTDVLEKIRYKDGILNGYPSRLHYFSEWIANNQKKGLVTDITSDLGGHISTKEINFMSAHRNLYPFLKDNDTNLKQIQASENYLNDKEICILPKNEIKANEHLIKSGDIIALTTSIKGLDITHTGIATREEDGRIHLLHASTSGSVKVTKKPLADYLKGIKNNTGIMVVRVNN